MIESRRNRESSDIIHNTGQINVWSFWFLDKFQQNRMNLLVKIIQKVKIINKRLFWKYIWNTFFAAYSLTMATVSLHSLNEIGIIYLNTVSGLNILASKSIYLAINSLIRHFLGSFCKIKNTSKKFSRFWLSNIDMNSAKWDMAPYFTSSSYQKEVKNRFGKDFLK